MNRLQEITKEEYTDKLKRIKSISDLNKANISQKELATEFNTDEHDKLMSSLFDDNYYKESYKQKERYFDSGENAELMQMDFDKSLGLFFLI